MLDWLTGHSPAQFHCADSSVNLEQKAGTSTTWAALCKEATPPSYTCPPLLNGHVQTMRILLDKPQLPIYHKRWMFEQANNLYPGEFTVDFVVEPSSEFDDASRFQTAKLTEEEFKEMASLDAKPMLVVLHGMNGGSHESYLRRTLMPLYGNGGGGRHASSTQEAALVLGLVAGFCTTPGQPGTTDKWSHG